MAYDLERFVTAHDEHHAYPRALAELRNGRKTGHWMWFVFPQIAGLGSSVMSRHFAIGSLAEARAYVDHPVLGPRLVECAQVLAALHDRSAVQILGSVDAQKLRSSMTLFTRADANSSVFDAVLERYFDGRPDPATEQRL